MLGRSAFSKETVVRERSVVTLERSRDFPFSLAIRNKDMAREPLRGRENPLSLISFFFLVQAQKLINLGPNKRKKKVKCE